MTKINRKALVDRHKIILTETDLKSPLTVGNGKFGFTADITGLQTFPKEYKRKQPLCTLSEWGWHSHPMPEYLKGKEFKLTEYKTGGRMVGYASLSKGQGPLYAYLRNNPHRFHLGRIGFSFVEETKIILGKYEPACIFCKEVQDTVVYKKKLICEKCIRTLASLI